jgi:hypothetical protein
MVNKTLTQAKKARSLIGKQVEIVPWHRKFSDGGYTGKLKSVDKIRTSSYNVEEHKRKRLSDDARIVFVPDKPTKKWLKDLHLMKPKDRTFSLSMNGHKIRGQETLK